MPDDDLALDDPFEWAEAAAWGGLALAGIAAGATYLVMTAWMFRTAWHVMGDTQARHFLGLP